MKTTKTQRKAKHRELTKVGMPRHKDGNRLGLRSRMAILREDNARARREWERDYAGHLA